MESDPSGWERPRRPICNMTFNDFAHQMKAQPWDKKGAKAHKVDMFMHTVKPVSEIPINIRI